jgi:hypothetical protein
MLEMLPLLMPTTGVAAADIGNVQQGSGLASPVNALTDGCSG